MKAPTYEATAIETAGKDLAARIDASVKRVMSSKQIVAHVMQAVVSEYKNCTIDEIIPLIGKVSVSEEAVDPDTVMPAITNESTEDNSIQDGRRLYDIKFTAATPDNQTIALIINLEIQNRSALGYSLIKRALYYTSRMISAQYGTVFKNSEYDKIRKVYSIWICTSPEEKLRNTISNYRIVHDVLLGEIADTPQDVLNYDLTNVTMICLGDSDTKEYGGIIRMLRTLFSNKCPINEKKSIMENEYNIPMTEELSEEVDNMCNISSMYYNDGIKEGMEKGIKKGIKEGMEKGIKKGMEKGMEKGIKKGIMDEKTNIVLEMFKKKFSNELIAEITHLSADEVEKIISSDQ